MSRPVPVVRRVTLLAVAGVGVASLVVGCGAGQVSQTADIETVTSGVDAAQGPIQILNAEVAAPVGAVRWPAGATVPVTMHVLNSGDVADRLVRATSPAAGSVRLVRATASASVTASPTGSPTATGTASPTPPPPASAGPTVSPSPPPSAGTASPDPERVPGNPQTTAPVATPTGTASPSPTTSGNGSVPVPLEPTTLVAFDQGEVQLLLVDLVRSTQVGEMIEVTLEFERAGRLTLRLPVATPDSPLPRTSPTHGEAEGHE